MQGTEMFPTFVLASVEPKMLGNVTQQLKTLDGITWFAPLTGRFDLVLQLKVTDHKQIYELVNRVRSIRGVVATSTYIPFEGFTNGKKIEASDSLALVLLRAKEQVPRVLQTLKQLPHIYGAFVVPGEFDILATLYGKNYEEIVSQVLKVAEIEGIRTSETLFAYKPQWA